MNAEVKTGFGSTLLLLILGVLALYARSAWLPLLTSAAALVWYGGSRLAGRLKAGRN